MTITLGVAQAIYLLLWAVGAIMIIAKDGRSRGIYNAPADLLWASFVLWLIWYGGFFS